MADFYSVLGLTRSASRGEIKAAFRKAAVEHHPDKWAPGLKPASYILSSFRWSIFHVVGNTARGGWHCRLWFQAVVISVNAHFWATS